MFISIINDCRDDNVMNRQVTRATSLFHAPVSFAGVVTDLEAAGNLIDTLDSALSEEGIILVNVAPRHGKAKKWPNGTPFGLVTVGKYHIFSTVDGATLSLLHKYGLADHVDVYDIPTVIAQMIEKGHITAEKGAQIIDTQFRSFEFLPRVAKWHHDGIDLPTEKTQLSELLSAPKAIWWVDNFGNCKTTLWPEDIGFEPGKVISTTVGELPCYARLKDVPNDEAALIVGSSGLDSRRFIELVVQGKSAAQRFNVASGHVLIQ